ncbi:MAG: ribose 5-phosphate isomerase B [Bacilli bacterium]|jgi:ribose 5-phosphate isomerase B
MKIAVGCDHGGLELKNAIKDHLLKLGHNVEDFGTFTKDSVHYPIYALKVAKSVSTKETDFGVLVCTSGEGVCIVANKVRGVRCGIGYNDDVTRLMRQHNNANIIAFGQAFISVDDAMKRVDIFLKTSFDGGRHQIRVDMIDKI